MKIHLGCGQKIIDGYLNVDGRDLPGVDLVCDIKTLPDIKPASADLIYVCHVLEHVGRLEYKDVLKRWFEVLRPGGLLRVAVPDMRAVFNHYAKHGDLMVLRGFLWGGQTYEYNYHYCGWDFDTLRKDLEEAGFRGVRRYDWTETEHAHIDDFSQCYLPHMDKENGMLMSLNVEAIKPL